MLPICPGACRRRRGIEPAAGGAGQDSGTSRPYPNRKNHSCSTRGSIRSARWEK